MTYHGINRACNGNFSHVFCGGRQTGHVNVGRWMLHELLTYSVHVHVIQQFSCSTPIR